MKKLRITFIFFLIAFISKGQQHYFKNYSVKEGLLQSNVTCGIQSQKGYLWLGTEGGLSKFDGIAFENFGKSDGLAESKITAIYQDGKERIWVGHQNGGITLIYPSNKKVVVFSDTLIKNTISSIVEDEKGNIWLATLGSGAYKFHPDSNTSSLMKYKKYLGKEGLGDYIFQIYTDRDNKIWFVTDVGLKSTIQESNNFKFEKIEGLPSYQITSITKDIDRNLWIGTYQGGLFKYNETTKNLARYTTQNNLASNWISTIIQASDKTIWVGTWGGGLSKIAQEEIKTYTSKNGIPDQKIRFLLEDRENNIIIGTNEHGCAIFGGEKFEIFNTKTGLSDNQVWAIEKIGGKLIIGHNKGIDIIEKEQIEHIQGFDYSVRTLKTFENKVWIGTWGKGVYTLNIDNKSIKEEKAINEAIDRNVNNISIDEIGTVWISTIKGLSSYNPSTLELRSYPGIIGKVELDIAKTLPIADNQLILSTRKNGLILCSEDKEFSKIAQNDIFASPSSSVYSYDKNTLYVGTEGGGVYVLKENKIVSKINSKSGLQSDFIFSLELDEENNILWIATNKGLSSYDLNTKEIQNFTELDGFTPIEGKLNAIKYDQKTIYIGTVGGLVRLKYVNNKINKVPPIINISTIEVNKLDTLLKNEVELSYKYNSLTFHFDAICLTNSANIKYQVKLDGWDEWHQLDNPSANYSNLPEGNYTFLIKATNNNGIWNEKPLSFSFTIHPPFWRTWWFYLICSISIIILITLFIKLREKKLQQEKRALALKVKERTAEVVQKSKELEGALEHIQSSIVYAQRIQQAILPTDKWIKEELPNSFVLFKPRDVVSGDFYWMERSGDELLFSAIDCTGHGVPGAFVSMVGHNLLNQSVRKHGLTKPSEILDDLHREVQKTLQSNDDSSVKDGMDLALCSYNRKKNTLQYAGAHNQMYLIREGELIEYKANRFAIGYKGRDEGKLFTNHEIEIQQGDVVYIFSDGFVDQFGGDQGRKYMSKRFKRYLLEIHLEDSNDQKEKLDVELKDWISDKYKQIDDVLVWGIRFD